MQISKFNLLVKPLNTHSVKIDIGVLIEPFLGN